MKALARCCVSSFWLGGKSVSAGSPCHPSPGHGCLPHTHSHPELEIQRQTPVIWGPRCVQLCYCDWAPGVYTGTPRSAMLHRYHGFYRLKVCSNPGLTKSAPFFHFSNRVCLLCVYVCELFHCLWIFSTFTLLNCDSLWSVIFDVTATTHWRFRWRPASF